MPPLRPSDPKAETADQREYLFDMLAQLARIAASCGEFGIELILKTIVVSRGADAIETAPIGDQSLTSE